VIDHEYARRESLDELLLFEKPPAKNEVFLFALSLLKPQFYRIALHLMLNNRQHPGVGARKETSKSGEGRLRAFHSSRTPDVPSSNVEDFLSEKAVRVRAEDLPLGDVRGFQHAERTYVRALLSIDPNILLSQKLLLALVGNGQVFFDESVLEDQRLELRAADHP
jgi:hypothetical protein